MNEKNNQIFLIPKKEEKKNVPFKKLNFNPLSYFTKKHKEDINRFIKKNNNIYRKISNNNKSENEIINCNFVTRKKFKLKPLNMTRSNFNIKINYKIDDIIIPSNKTSKELIEYNKANMHNTLLNYYNRHNRNLKIINFVKTNSFEQNKNCNLSNKLNSSNDSFNNNNSFSFNIPNINNNQQNLENILKNKQMKKTISEIGLKKLKRKTNIRKSTIDIYESEILENKQICRNLNYFHDFFFDKNDINISNKPNLIFKPENKMKSSKIDLSNVTKKKINYNKVNNNNVFSFLLKNKTRNKKIFNNNKMILSLKEMKALSFKGYKRMKADKKRQFDFKLKNTGDEVFKLEKKLDELFEKNRQLFLNVDNGL